MQIASREIGEVRQQSSVNVLCLVTPIGGDQLLSLLDSQCGFADVLPLEELCTVRGAGEKRIDQRKRFFVALPLDERHRQPAVRFVATSDRRML